jgi:hypothetical protein
MGCRRREGRREEGKEGGRERRRMTRVGLRRSTKAKNPN